MLTFTINSSNVAGFVFFVSDVDFGFFPIRLSKADAALGLPDLAGPSRSGRSSSSPNRSPPLDFFAFLPLDDGFFLTADSASLLSRPGRSESESKSTSLDLDFFTGFIDFVFLITFRIFLRSIWHKI